MNEGPAVKAISSFTDDDIENIRTKLQKYLQNDDYKNITRDQLIDIYHHIKNEMQLDLLAQTEAQIEATLSKQQEGHNVSI